MGGRESEQAAAESRRDMVSRPLSQGRHGETMARYLEVAVRKYVEAEKKAEHEKARRIRRRHRSAKKSEP